MMHLDTQLDKVLETFRSLPDRAKERASEEYAKTQRSDGRQPRRRKPDPGRRARQLERSQAGPKKGPSHRTDPHAGGKQRKK